MSVATTTVVNIRLHEYDIYVGRAGKGHDGYFGNPTRRAHEHPGLTLSAFCDYFYERMESDAEFSRRVFDLRGKRLGCFCVEHPWTVYSPGAFYCHAQVMAHYIENNVE
jgi:hypothetical protein